MMKKLPVIIFTLLLFSSLTLRSALANKCGINIGSHYFNVDRVAQLTKTGGWIVSLGSPGNCSNFEFLFGKNLNVVIRAYNGGKKFTNEQALGWVATLGKMDAKGQKIYFMPWNEPNHIEEGGGSTYGNDVYEYSKFLKDNLQEAGLLGTKVVLLSPMIDKLNPSFWNPDYPEGTFFTNPGGKSSFYQLFAGSSINEYDQFDPGPCSPNVHLTQNNCEYKNIGVSPPFYSLETGVAGTCAPYPCYRDTELAAMLNRVWSQWNADNDFKMFAIFSYNPMNNTDTWSIFSDATASRVKSFYANNCQPGEVETGNMNEAKFAGWLEKQNLVACDGCGYATHAGYCTATGIYTGGEPVVIDPQNSLICQNLDIEYRKGESETITSTPTPTNTPSWQDVRGISQTIGSRVYSGEFWLEKMGFPDLSKMEQLLSNALEKLLPADLNQQVAIDSQPLNSRIKHFITGKYPTGTPQPTPSTSLGASPPPIPETEISQPGWFTSLLGVTRIICALFNVCPATSSLTVQISQPDVNTLSNSLNSNTNFCPQGYLTTSEDAGPNTLNKNFQTSAYFERTIETTEVAGSRTTTTSEKADLQDKTRGLLVGGETLNQQYPFLNAFLPAELITEDSFALKNQADYAISPDYYQIKSEEAVNYQNLSAARAFCLQQCSLLPSGSNINSVYSFCKSCNPKDYPLVSLDMAFCTMDGSGICNYCTPDHTHEGCGSELDPFCEGGLCCPYQYGQAIDYQNHGCEAPYKDIAPDCFDPAVCRLAKFAANPDGGFGACHYSSPEVCVRTDRMAVGYCAATCNYVCCSGQK